MKEIYASLRVNNQSILTFFVCFLAFSIQAENIKPSQKVKAEDLVVVAGHTNTNCYGGEDGTAFATITGGVPPYIIIWNNGQTTDTIKNLNAGSYVVTVTDFEGTVVTGGVELLDPPLLYGKVILSDSILDCNTQQLTATQDMVGGVLPYSYEWTFPYNIIQTEQTVNIYQPANYQYKVIDANGCTFSGDTTILAVGIPIVTLTLIDTVSCNGLSDGSASSVVVGGEAPYTYHWSNGQTGDTLVNVKSGAYLVTVTDAVGCIGQAAVFIPQPNTLTLTVTGSDITCYGQSTGMIFTTVGGGTPGYEYLWNNNSPNSNLFNIEAGAYTVTVIDAHGCTVTGGVTITEGNEINIFTSTFPVTCFGGNNGQALAFATGGAGVFQYNWSNGATGAQVTDLEAGVYTVFVTDLKNCVESTTVNVTEPDKLIITLNSTPEILGGADGTVSVTAIGGTPPYTYIWSTGSTTDSDEDLVAGEYFVTVTDHNGCSAIDSINVVPSNCAFSASLLAINPSCFNMKDGALFPIIEIPGAEPYYYIWSDDTHDVILDSLGTGTYSVTIIDNANCMISINGSIKAPDPVDVQFQITQPSGPDNPTATIILEPGGGTPPYKATYNGTDYTSGGNITISGIPSGPHTIIVKDSKGCEVIVQFNVDQFDCQISANITDPLEPQCKGSNSGQLCVDYFNNFGPVTIDWSNGQHTDCITNIPAGNYTVVVRDTLGCTATKQYFLEEPDYIQLSNVVIIPGSNNFDGSIKLNVIGGTPPFTYEWKKDNIPFATTRDITGLNAGKYDFKVTDSRGCIVNFESIIIQVSSSNAALISNEFKIYPNPANSILTIENNKTNGIIDKVMMMNMTGEKRSIKTNLIDKDKINLDLSGFPDGPYILCIIRDNKTYYTKIIKAQ